MKNTLKTAGALSVFLTAAVPAAAQDAKAFLDDLADAGTYESACTQDGLNGVLFSGDEQRFVPFAAIGEFIEKSYGRNGYEAAHDAFRDAKGRYLEDITALRMRGNNLPDCRR